MHSPFIQIGAALKMGQTEIQSDAPATDPDGEGFALFTTELSVSDDAPTESGPILLPVMPDAIAAPPTSTTEQAFAFETLGGGDPAVTVQPLQGQEVAALAGEDDSAKAHEVSHESASPLSEIAPKLAADRAPAESEGATPAEPSPVQDPRPSLRESVQPTEASASADAHVPATPAKSGMETDAASTTPQTEKAAFNTPPTTLVASTTPTANPAAPVPTPRPVATDHRAEPGTPVPTRDTRARDRAAEVPPTPTSPGRENQGAGTGAVIAKVERSTSSALVQLTPAGAPTQDVRPAAKQERVIPALLEPTPNGPKTAPANPAPTNAAAQPPVGPPTTPQPNLTSPVQAKSSATDMELADTVRRKVPTEVIAPPPRGETTTGQVQTGPQSPTPTTATPITALPASSDLGPLSALAPGEPLAETSDHLLAAIGSASTIGASTGLQTTPMAQSAGAQMVSAMLAHMASPARDQPLEIALDPPELGRVRMSLSQVDGVLTLSILADRPETLDLMRRHVELLGQEFTRAGLGNTEFSFGQSSHRERGAEGTDPQPTETPQATADMGQGPSTIRPGHNGALDLRL